MTTLTIDDSLIQEAQIIGNQPSKQAVVAEALREYIARRKQLQIVELFGTIEYEADYDYKEQRQRS